MRLMPAGKIYITVPRGGFFHSRGAARNTGEKEGPGAFVETPGPSLRRENKEKRCKKVKLRCQGVDKDYGRPTID
jgi:hypothetical protein